MIHAKSESDMTSSLDGSSPRSPKRTVYYVQSPSHSDKSSAVTGTVSLTQMTATPTSNNSPMESPSHPYTSSTASRVSGGVKKKTWWSEKHVIKEEDEESRLVYEGNDYYEKGLLGLLGFSVASCRVLLGVFGFFVIFTLFCSFLWLATRSVHPRIFVESINMNSFYYGEGSDRTGVPTKMLTLNATVKIVTHNPATFFGIHVSIPRIHLKFSDLVIATGQVKKYYQPRKSKRTEIVEVIGRKVPLYGAGAYVASSDQNGGVPMKLEIEVQSRGYVVGNLVKTNTRRRFSCFFVLTSTTIAKPINLIHKSCILT